MSPAPVITSPAISAAPVTTSPTTSPAPVTASPTASPAFVTAFCAAERVVFPFPVTTPSSFYRRKRTRRKQEARRAKQLQQPFSYLSPQSFFCLISDKIIISVFFLFIILSRFRRRNTKAEVYRPHSPFLYQYRRAPHYRPYRRNEIPSNPFRPCSLSELRLFLSRAPLKDR